jgi:AraC family transcriptional regulator
MGSPSFTTVEAGSFRITDAWFPPRLKLSPHVHDRTSVALMLEGGFDLSIRGRDLVCRPSTVATEPAGETHGNLVGVEGAHVLVIQPDPADAELHRICADVLDEVRCFSQGDVARAGWRLAHEVRNPDAVSPLAIESLALDILATSSRLRAVHPAARRPPAWLLTARDVIHARFLDRLRTGAIAAEVGVHPVHLARVFRSHFRTTVGDYARRLRLEWAATRLARSEDSIADIALTAGFADQSHFTRVFKRHAGMTPDRFRRSARS